MSLSAHASPSTPKSYVGPIFDADTHIWEKDFSFMECYLPDAVKKDWLVARKIGPDGRFGLHVGDRMVENAEANAEGLVPPPGKLKEWLRAMKEGKSNVEGWLQPTDDMIGPEARLLKMDEFGVERAILFVGEFVTTFAYYPQNAIGNQVLHAYNQYVDDHWGFARDDRLFATGLLSLWDLESSVAEAKWLVERGCRVVCMPMGPAGGRSPADPYFDPVWTVLNDASIAVTYHVSEASFMHPLIREFGETPLQSRRTGQTAWQWMFCYSELPVQITLANIIYHNFFARFPNIRIASVENGANWLPYFLEKMDKMRDPLTMDNYLAARMVSDPLGVLDCCLVTDGGGAIVMTRADRARDLARPPVFVLGAASVTTHHHISAMPDLLTTGAAEAGARAYAAAGLGPQDMQVVQLYDAFTINTILFLEDLGFCAKGEGASFVEDGAIAPGGRLAVNTNGGGLSCMHPGMYGLFTVIEAVRQLRAEAGERQVSDVQVALAHGNGGVLSSQGVVILGNTSVV